MGLAGGVVLVLLVQLLIQRASAPDSGLRNLINAAKRPAAAPAKKPAAPARPAQARKPKFDFYTILPEIETVIPDQPGREHRKASPEAGVVYVLQAGAFAAHADADRLKARLALNGLVARIQKVSIEGRGEFHRVRLGPFRDRAALDAAHARLRDLGIPAMRLKVKRGG